MRLRCRARAPGSLTQRVLRSQTILLDTNEHRCNTASLQSPAFDSALHPSVAASYRIVEHRHTALYAPFPSATHHSVTSIAGSTGRPLQHYPYRGLVTAASTQLVQACVLTQCVQLCDHSWYTCERLRIATFCARLFSHTFTQTSVDATQPLCRAVWRNLTATVFLLSLLVLSGFVGFIHD